MAITTQIISLRPARRGSVVEGIVGQRQLSFAYPLRDPFAGRRIRWSEHAKPSVKREALGQAGALVVAEPTGIKPLVGHKGALWLGRSPKASPRGLMPEKGVSAIYKAARAVTAL
jgi:hypothetical protein